MRRNRQLQLTPVQRACSPCGVNVHCPIGGEPDTEVGMCRAVSDRLTGAHTPPIGMIDEAGQGSFLS